MVGGPGLRLMHRVWPLSSMSGFLSPSVGRLIGWRRLSGQKQKLCWEIREEVGEWVTDPGLTMGRVSSYERIMLSYCVVKKILFHVIMDRENKELGDADPAHA